MINVVLSYCKAANIDPMLKPVHIVPMWDAKTKVMKDVIMPGIGLYRIIASRTGKYAGMSTPEFGVDITENLGGVSVTYPKSCKITVKKIMDNGTIADFTVVEFWKENYAVKGGLDKSIAPNSMWAKRPYGQLAKCAKAQAMREAFPEVGAQPTADEMEGRGEVEINPITEPTKKRQEKPASAPIEQPATDQKSSSLVWPQDKFDTKKIALYDKYQEGTLTKKSIFDFLTSKNREITDEQRDEVNSWFLTDETTGEITYD
jgi:phage recombination protein Bet